MYKIWKGVFLVELDMDLQSIQEVRNIVKLAKKAQLKYLEFTQEQVDKIVKFVAETAFLKSMELAEHAVKETGMGVVTHKRLKNETGSMAVYDSIKNEKTVGIIHEDGRNKMVEVAYPFGVIAGIIPTTNPTSTAIFKSLIALKTKNAIVFSPHPRAAQCTIEALKICHDAAVQAGAPEDLIGWISNPSMEATVELMKHKDINLILATGGGGLVKAAYSSGKPAYGVGPGNVPCYVEKSANIQKSISMIIDSKSFDNGTLCSSEQSIIVDETVKELVLRELKKNGAYLLNKEEKSKLEKIISPSPRMLNPAIVGQSALKIAGMAGISVPIDTRVLIAEETQVGKDIPFSIEKLSPILGLYIAKTYEEAKNYCHMLLNIGGRGHSLALHTNNDEIARDFAIEMPVSRILVNTLSSIGAVGSTTALAPTLTLGCGSFGGNITSDNVSARHLINIKRMAYGIKEVHIPKQLETTSSYPEFSEDREVGTIVNQVLNNFHIKGKADSKTIAAVVSQVLQNYQKSEHLA